MVGYYAVIWADDPNRTVLEREYVEITLREYLVRSERGHGFLIDAGTQYNVVYYNDRRQLCVNGFYIDCDLMDYFPGCTYLPSKNPGTIEKKIARYST